jgi:hypothetical protein
VATNPNGLAQAGNLLFLVDYDSRKVYQIGANELNGLPSGIHSLFYAPLDLSSKMSATSKGQDIIAITGPDGNIYVFALFVDNQNLATVWNASTLVMMRLDPVTGAFAYVTHISLGINAQEIIPVVSDYESVTFLIPCYGGEQHDDGTTNGVASMIQMVNIKFNNPVGVTPKTLITGDAAATPPTAYDIRALAARLGGGWLYILCGTMNDDATNTQNWTLYKADLALVLKIDPQNPLTLSAAVNQSIMEVVDCGNNDPGYYWDICIEAGIDILGDRLWFLKGSDIVVTGAEAYCDDVKNFNSGYGIGETGGDNVNCAAFIAETLRQAAIGLSMKRGLVGSMIPIVSAAAQGETQKY